MKKLVLAVIAVCLMGPRHAFADTLQWQTPLGLINLNLSTTETLIGYDGILKQALAGVDLPIYTTPKNIVTLKIGADAPWQTNGATVEPLILAGHNILAEIPGLSAYPNAQLNIFGRYAASTGKAGAGIAFSYSFGNVSPTPVTPAP